MNPRRGRFKEIWQALLPTFRYWMQTEVHVFSFSIAANVLLSFFPFLIVLVSMSQAFFNRETTVAAIDLALKDYFPEALGNFLHNNLPSGGHASFLSIFLLLFTANGIFEPLEVALNHVWGISKNRSFLRNQIVSLVLIFGCGALALLSLWLTELRQGPATQMVIDRWTSLFFFKLAGVPLTSLILFLIYRYLPNGRPPLNRVIPAAIGVGVLLELFKYINMFAWHWFDQKLVREYGVFRYSATLIFLSFLASMLVLGGAEWSARGNRLGKPIPPD